MRQIDSISAGLKGLTRFGRFPLGRLGGDRDDFGEKYVLGGQLFNVELYLGGWRSTTTYLVDMMGGNFRTVDPCQFLRRTQPTMRD